jgi:F0F1-type ATP synthase membrane subunit b/b'
MSRDTELDVLATRLFQYADSPLLERHRSMQDDLLRAAHAVMELAAVLRAYEANREDAAKRS